MTGQPVAAAFQSLYDATQRQVLIYLTARCGDPADIADLFQETYAELYAVLCRRGAGYVENGEAFLKKLAKQQLHKHYSRRAFRAQASLEDLAQEPPAPSEEIDDRLVTDELLRQVHASLSNQPPLTQKIFSLHYSLDLTLAQTAKELGVSESFVKNRLYRTIAALRREFCI